MYTSLVIAMILTAILLTAASCTAKTAHNLCHHHQAFIPSPPTRRREAINKHSISLLLAKKYDNEKKKISQQEILLDLDRKFDYEGRISSKIVDVSDDDNDDVVTTTTSEDEESIHPHRCALLTILG